MKMKALCWSCSSDALAFQETYVWIKSFMILLDILILWLIYAHGINIISLG